MGKDKEHKTEAPGNAFSRMNYLYQAAYLMTDNSVPNALSRYYIKTMKEISKKVVEKLHPDLKRTVCCACNFPLTGKSAHIKVKVKPVRKSRKKKKKRNNDKVQNKKESEKRKTDLLSSNTCYTKSRMESRNVRPNKISWCCCKCGYNKKMLQKPSYKLWIHQVQESL